MLKVNTDGSFCADTRSGGWGAIVGDCQGQAILAATGSLKNLQDALHAETMASIAALKIANQFGMGQIILESDALKSELVPSAEG